MAAVLRSLFAVAMLIVAGVDAHAVEVDNLYGAQAIVTGTEEPERTRGFRAGLVDVVVKLTGDARLAEGNRLQSLLEHPQHFVASFEYEDRMKGIPVHDEQGTRERPHFLRMRFDKPAIDAALTKLGLSTWPPDRPLLAVWLGVRTATDAYVLRASGPKGYGQRLVIMETSARRGIPVLLPVPGRSTATVTFDDIAAGNIAAMKGASQRADAILSGLLSYVPGGYWNIDWRLTDNNRSRDWGQRNVSFDTALKAGLETSALFLSGNAPF